MGRRRAYQPTFCEAPSGHLYEDVDTCTISTEEGVRQQPLDNNDNLLVRDFKWAMDALEGSQEQGFIKINKYQTAGSEDPFGFVNVWSHRRLLVLVRLAPDETWDGPIYIGTTDIRDILSHIEQEIGFCTKKNTLMEVPNCEGSMTYLGPNNMDVDLEWAVQLDKEYTASRTYPHLGDMDQIIVQV